MLTIEVTFSILAIVHVLEVVVLAIVDLGHNTKLLRGRKRPGAAMPGILMLGGAKFVLYPRYLTSSRARATTELSAPASASRTPISSCSPVFGMLRSRTFAASFRYSLSASRRWKAERNI